MDKTNLISKIKLNDDKTCVIISFSNDVPNLNWKFHAQWLANACCTNGFSKSSDNSPFNQQICTIKSAKKSPNGDLLIEWSNSDKTSNFPSLWLKTIGTIVAKPNFNVTETKHVIKYWNAKSITIPEVEWGLIMGDNTTEQQIQEQVIDMLINDSSFGIIKVINLPPADIESERQTKDTLITKLLNKVFGNVFFHTRRGANKTFNVSTIKNSRAELLDNYDVKKVLLPHTDHAHYIHPAMVMGLYALEGSSINTWLDGFIALEILKQEDPESFRILCNTPLCFGRIANYYTPALYQANIDTPITLYPGSQRIRRIKWHPHLIGWINSSFNEYPKAFTASQKLQQIMMRPDIQIKLEMKPGDLYIWNNFRILHGRQSVFSEIRTIVGQTVPEEVVMNRTRENKIAQITSLNKNWLAQIPTELLDQIILLEKYI